MRVILFGGTGMVGQGVLRECILDPDVTKVLSVVRSPGGKSHPKLHELVHRDFLDFSNVASELSGYDACFYCLGATSAGKSEAEYTRITYDITVAAGHVLAGMNAGMTFVFVSGAGTDSTEKGRTMWARVKGKAENALFRLPFKAVYAFRPGLIQAMHGVESRTALYRIPYKVLAPFVPWLRRRFPQAITTTEQIGRAMLVVAKRGAPKQILESADINAL
jgi:uncharacterized protein YbjT (DUF2867 family)